MREEKHRTWRKLAEEKELLIYTNFSVISFSCFFQEFLMIHHSFLVRECNSIDTLQRVVVFVAAEVAGGVLDGRYKHNEGYLRATVRYLHDLESLDLVCVLYVRTQAQVDERATLIHSASLFWE